MKSADSMTRVLRRILIGVFCLICSGCGNGHKKTAEELSQDGWSEFGKESYPTALSHFDSAIAKDPSFVDAFLGAGWSNLYLAEADTAIVRFSVGRAMITDDSLLPDFDVGLALSYFEIQEYTKAVDFADSCLERVPSYEFSRRSTVNHIDLIVTKANAYFQLGGDTNLTSAANLISEIDSEISLDPQDSSTWVIEGETYPSFTQALVRALEIVSEVAASS